MTPQEYLEITSRLYLFTHTDRTKAIGLKSHSTSHNYATGKTPVPEPVAKLLRAWIIIGSIST